MAIKYYLHQDAIQKWGVDTSIKRYILQRIGEQAVDAEEIKPTPVSNEDSKPQSDSQ